MDLSEAIKGRRSIRKFKAQPVSKETIEKILDLALWAPSGTNRQEWYFVVVRGEKKEALLKFFAAAFETVRPNLEKVFADKPKIVEGMKSFFQTYGGAPVFIVAYAGKSSSGQWDTHSTAVALQNLLLAAYAEGLGGVWTDGILVKEPEINALLGIEGKKLVAVVPLGYPDEVPRVPPRRSGRVQWVGFEWGIKRGTQREKEEPTTSFLGISLKATALTQILEAQGFKVASVVCKAGQTFFVHHTAITSDSFKTLSEGQKVRFEVEETSKGPKAKDVQII